MTAPLTPPDCDLRGYEYMPLYGHHLFGSGFDASCSDFAWRTGVTLWWAAWNQVPAASLPNDDVAITKLALLGRDVKSFRKVKEQALRGFVLCDDGRLYHTKLAPWAIEAWERRQEFEEGRENKTERQKRWRKHQKELSAQLRALGVTPPVGASLASLETLLASTKASTPASTKSPDETSTETHERRVGSEVKRSEVEVQEPSVGENLGNSTAVDNPEIRGDKSPKINSYPRVQSWKMDPSQVAIQARRVGIERRPNESESEFIDRVDHATRHPQSATG